jgi:hypothetical protein
MTKWILLGMAVFAATYFIIIYNIFKDNEHDK